MTGPPFENKDVATRLLEYQSDNFILRTKLLEMFTLNNINFTLADRETAQELITSKDTYLESLSTYDFQLRHIVPPYFDKYLELAKQSIRDFDEPDEGHIAKVLKLIFAQLDKYGMQLPTIDNINFVNSDTRTMEMGAGGYTRGKTIYLSPKMVKLTNLYYMAQIICHELFHLFSRNCPEFRKKMYDIIGFTIMEADIPIPSFPNLSFISSPDIEHHDSFVEVSIDGTLVRGVIIDSGKTPLLPKSCLLKIMRPYLVILDSDNMPTNVYYDIFSHKKIREELEKKMGDDDGYCLLDPDECLAVHFVQAVLDDECQDNSIVNEIRRKLAVSL